MTTSDSPVTEEELHGYVDGELPADRNEAVVVWLSAHPDQAALVGAWRTQADSIRARYGAVANEPVPDRLHLDEAMKQDRPSTRSWAAVGANGSCAQNVAHSSGGGAIGVAPPAMTSPTGLKKVQ